MNKTVYYLVFLGIFIFSGLKTEVYSQEKEKIVGEDKTFSTPFCSAAMGWTLPFGEMQNRYEPFLRIMPHMNTSAVIQTLRSDQ